MYPNLILPLALIQNLCHWRLKNKASFAKPLNLEMHTTHAKKLVYILKSNILKFGANPVLHVYHIVYTHLQPTGRLPVVPVEEGGARTTGSTIGGTGLTSTIGGTGLTSHQGSPGNEDGDTGEDKK
ncbi:hypothetical protein HYC85_030518 [Camellia sinensis]|uniref:Uncharacterized protein n=1 Tax=Camellia sinensis TaxID=4442 RepID=A0A7J7G1L0_CAMSI|nr:hypothetical protein HYC85_030518 [Camellia sinensis]